MLISLNFKFLFFEAVNVFVCKRKYFEDVIWILHSKLKIDLSVVLHEVNQLEPNHNPF